MKAKTYLPDELIPHRQCMSLIDSIDSWGPDWLACSVYHKPGCAFSDENGSVPSWIGLEYMCQAIAALEGTQRLANNKAISLGFVMGTKKLNAKVALFERNQHVKIRVEEEMKNTTSLGVYSCKILNSENALLVEALIKAIMPEDPKTLLSQRQEKQP